jgi:hypothetical protein
MLELPDLPARPQAAPPDWRRMAREFDRYVTDRAQHVMFETPEGHTAFTAFLEGQEYGTRRHELTAFGPLVLGKALLGDDVRAFAPSLAMFFDEEQGIFLNRPGSPREEAREEWWYLMNINALAAHLVRVALIEDARFVGYWQQSAATLVELAHRVEYDFNTQGYDFSARAPWTDRDIFRQPDTIAAYAYLMLLASTVFPNPVYLEEARTAMRKYLAFPANPWYEIPSAGMGVAAAAHLLALGDEVDVARALRFALDPRAALALGVWGGEEVNGLMRGWRHSAPESVYSMESMVLLPYLLPAVRKVPALAREVGKYALHAAANARLFYSGNTPHESRPDLSPWVAYERLYQDYGGQSPYAAGDFAGHKSIYGGGYVLWWGALIRPTSDAHILRLDLTRSDFLDRRAPPTFLLYNPYPEQRRVTIQPGGAPLAVPAGDALVVTTDF